MAQLFYRRHYETLERVLGAAYMHVTSQPGRQALDLTCKMLSKVLQDDAPTFDPKRFRQVILLFAGATADHPELVPEDTIARTNTTRTAARSARSPRQRKVNR